MWTALASVTAGVIAGFMQIHQLMMTRDVYYIITHYVFTDLAAGRDRVPLSLI